MKLIHKISAVFGGAVILLVSAVLLSGRPFRKVEEAAKWQQHTILATSGVLAVSIAALAAIVIRRDAKRQLQVQEQARKQAENIIATIREPFLVLDVEMRVEFANQAFYRLFQISPSETEGRSLFDLAEGQWNNLRLREKLNTIIPGDTEFEALLMEAEFAKAGRRILVLNGRKVYRPGNHTGRLLLAMEDITERTKAEAEVDRFFELSLDMLCIASCNGYFKRISPAFTETLGWSAKEFLTRPFLEFVHPEDREATLREVKKQVVGGESVLHFENRYLHKDGSWRTLSWNSGPQPDGLMYAVARDVTELKKAEAALQRVNEELEQRVHDRTAQLESSNVELKREIADRQRAEGALQAERAQLARRVAERTADLSAANAELARSSRLKSEFLANMSHELRTPLNAILGLSESLLEQRSGPLTERQIRSVITIESSGRHLLSLINDVLDVSKVEAGKLVLELEDVDTRAICEASFQLVRQQAMSKRQTLQFTCEMDARPLYADPRRIKQMLVNLLSNAVKFTPEGGRIGLEVMGDAAAGRITFTVWDTGIGIAPEDQPRLFQPFVQVQSALSREYEGTGLGLVLVQRLAELHGGSVKLESDSNRGSRFIVSLPWNHAHISSGPRRTVEAEPITGVRSALIIEDAYTAYEQLERYLTEMDVRSVIHECGTGAVDRAAKVSPDVILLDILLPDLSGWEVLRQLKSNDQTRHIPVIVISVVDERGTPQADGAAGYLVKPISREQLKAALGAPPGDFSSVVPAGPTILLAEDNEANIHTIGDYLLDHGFQLIVARNGAEAIEHLRTEIPALVLMDIQMPVMDGLEAIRHIRSDAALSGVPIIALTALAMAGDRERCLTAGADDYLSKPVTLRELEQRIRQLLELPA